MTVYDPAMCCGTGICGPDVDPILAQVAGMLAQLKERGVHVERFNLAQQPMAFVQNSVVRELLNREGVEVLPLTFVDGALTLKGQYPDQEMREQWIRENGATQPGSGFSSASSAGGCGCSPASVGGE